VHRNTEATISESPNSRLWKSRIVIQGSFLVLITGELYHIKATELTHTSLNKLYIPSYLGNKTMADCFVTLSGT
jgi:hypothetical protein